MKVILWETDKIAKVKCVWIVQIFESQQYLFLNKNSYLQEKELAQLWGLPSLRQWPVLKSQKLPQKAFWQILHRLCCSFTFTSCSVSSENIVKLLRQTLTLIFFTQLFYHWQENIWLSHCWKLFDWLSYLRVSRLITVNWQQTPAPAASTGPVQHCPVLIHDQPRLIIVSVVTPRHRHSPMVSTAPDSDNDQVSVGGVGDNSVRYHSTA